MATLENMYVDGDNMMTKNNSRTSLKKLVVIVCLWFLIHVYIFADYIGSESNHCDAEARKELTKHDTVGKNGILPPCLPFGPWIPEKRKIGHD